MIFDAHVHVWARWPYAPPVPDPETRAAPACLLWHMDRNGVDRALVICAAIGENRGNADFAFAAAAAAGGRLEVFPDLECRWAPEFRTPGAARRLAAALARWPQMRGFACYLAEDEPGDWLTGPEGRAFFALAAEHRLVASLSVLPHQMPHVVGLAERHPALVILLHHMAFLGPRTAATPDGAGLVAAAAACPNVFVKLSGMGNVAAPEDDYPYARLAWIPAFLHDRFGAGRLLWGSDWPVSCRHMTYRQTLLLVDRHGPGTPAEKAAIRGATLARLLPAASAPSARSPAAPPPAARGVPPAAP